MEKNLNEKESVNQSINQSVNLMALSLASDLKALEKASKPIKNVPASKKPKDLFLFFREKAKVLPILSTGYKVPLEKVVIRPTKTSKDLQVFAKAERLVSPFRPEARGQGCFLDVCMASGIVPAYKDKSKGIDIPERPATMENILYGMTARDLTAQASKKTIENRIRSHRKWLEVEKGIIIGEHPETGIFKDTGKREKR